MAEKDLSLPLKRQLTFTWRQLGVAALFVLVAVLAVVLVVTGQWRVARDLLLKVRLKEQQRQIDALNAKAHHNAYDLRQKKELRKKLEVERKLLEAKREATKLEVKGWHRDQIAAELRRRGY